MGDEWKDYARMRSLVGQPILQSTSADGSGFPEMCTELEDEATHPTDATVDEPVDISFLAGL